MEDMVISIRQETDSSENDLGWKLWDSSFILSKYVLSLLQHCFMLLCRWIYHNREVFQNKRVLELGSGCGYDFEDCSLC